MSAPSIATIRAAVARFYDLPAIDMVAARRDRPAAHARQVAMYLARQLTPHSLPVIGREFGGRDHTTVMFGIRAVENRISQQPEMKAAMDGLALLLGHPHINDTSPLVASVSVRA